MAELSEQQKKDAEQIRTSPLFDSDWYLATYPDVSALGMDPAEHYLKYGKLMGRSGVPVPGGPLPLPLPATLEPAKLLDTPFAEAFASKTLEEYRGEKKLADDFNQKTLPLVSIVMTSYNSKMTIEKSVNSALNQSYPNIEVIVCDDCSTDSTWEILTGLKRRSPKHLKIIRLECNSGTYLAKNVAIASSSGGIILFQDSDDYSHPDRALVQVLPLIKDEKIVATRTKYCRFGAEHGRIIPVAGLMSKYGLITLAVRRDAFDQIGYFDAVRRAGDDEWFQRLQHLYGPKSILGLDVTLYLAELRQGSLIADMLTFNVDGSVEQSSSLNRRDYVTKFRDRFSDTSKGRAWYKNAFPVYPLRPQAEYPSTISALQPVKIPVFAAICSIPKRTKQFTAVVERMLPQVDHLFVYLDKYDSVPAFLSGNPKVTIYRGQDFDIDFRDNAKFLAYNDLKKQHSSFYYLTIDDDLLYPYDYVHTMIDRIEEYQKSSVVGLHGVVCEEEPIAYFRRRFIYHFRWASIPNATLVNNIGTGTLAFHSDVFNEIDPRSWPLGGMVDIFFAIEAKRRNIPMLCMNRSAGWLGEMEMPADNNTLFGEFSDKEPIMVKHLRDNMPWGMKSINSAVGAQPPQIQHKLLELLPKFSGELSVKDTFGRFRG